MKTTLLPSLLLVALVGILTGAIFGFVGYNAGKDIGASIVYDASFAVGYVEAFNSNKSDGYNIGYNEGISQGILQGASQVNTTQIDRARSEGIAEGRRLGYSQGYEKGLEEGTLEGIKAGTEGFLISKRPDIKRELERESYICNSTNVCEKTVSNDAQTGRRVWSVFNLNTMTHTINVDYTQDGSQYKQRVIVNYKEGTMTAEWRLRTLNYSSPFVVYDFQSSRLIKNTTTLNDQDRIERLMTWYTGSASAKLIGDNAGISWVLSANRS